MEEIKPVVTEKNEFDYGDQTILVTFSWNFRSTSILT